MTFEDEHPVEALSAYVDGELEEGEKASVQEHLQACRSCSVLVEDMKRLSAAVTAEEPPPVPSDLAGRIGRRLGDSQAAREGRGRGWLLGGPLAAAASIAAAALIWTVWQTESPQDSMILEPMARSQSEEAGKPDQAGQSKLEARSERAGEPQEESSEDDATALPPESRPVLNARETPRLEAKKSVSPAVVAETADQVGRLDQPDPERRRGYLSKNQAPLPRELVLEMADYKILLRESGSLTLQAEGYECTVSGSAGEKTGEEADSYAPSPPLDGLEVASFFDNLEIETGKTSQDSVTADKDGARDLAMGDESMQRQGLYVTHADGQRVPLQSGAGLPGNAAPDAGAMALDLPTRLQLLVREDYRDALERECGPLPPPFDRLPDGD